MTTTTHRPLALVTGASSGIGPELARQFAGAGFDLIVNAEDDGLNAAAEQLRHLGVDVAPFKADLREFDGVEQLVDLNVRSTVHLAKRLLPDMVARNEGRVLITSSIASTMPGTYQAVYNASKSFLQSFAEAVAEELRDSEVVVTSLMPGPTETDFFRRADMNDTRVGAAEKDDPAEVARQGFEALMAGKDRVVGGGLKTKANELVDKVLPDRAKAAVHGVMAEPGSAPEKSDSN